MKKNKAMRAAGGLFVATMLTTSIISGTYAKYVTEGSATDNARVAKFGVTITGSGDLFGTSYVNAAGGNTPAGTGTLTVVSSNTDDVVAPGTENNAGLSFNVSGKPEVNVALTVSASYVDNKDIFLAAGTYKDMTGAGTSFTIDEKYNPIVWTLKKGTAVAKDSTGKELENVSLSEINSYFSGQTFNYAANTELSTAQNNFGDYNLTWKWAFGDSANNKADTVLGDLAADATSVKKGTTLADNLVSGEDYSLDISVKVSVTVAQID